MAAEADARRSLSIRAFPELIDRMKREADAQNRTLEKWIETVLTEVMDGKRPLVERPDYDDPLGLT